jgi:bifunctional non-homologous end joining protein LigD
MSSLQRYRKMRDFSLTREPRGGRTHAAGQRLSYYIQKHAASRLHYDFRLELDGALKSWAVPQGPSLDPHDRRLAVHVEDHPLEYGTFEGVIPKGEYGAGTVRVWDRGEWIPDGDPREGYRKGHLKFTLKGKRLHGRWALVAMRGPSGENGKNWLLIKEKDAETREAPKLGFIEPQLATLAAKVPAGGGWVHEIKFDGYRIQAEARASAVSLRSRRGHDWTAQFPGVAAALKGLVAASAVLDGEMVVMDPEGRSDFQLLQNALSERKTGEVVYYVFDLLELEGKDMRNEPLSERKRQLKELLSDTAKRRGEAFRSRVRYSEHIEGKGEQLFRHACGFALEGVICKLKEGPYRSGRSADWLKVKCTLEQEFVIAGFTDPGGARGGFGALVLGVREKGGLRYAGRVGTGFTQASLKELRERLDGLEAKRSPLSRALTGPEAKGVHWVKPVLVGEVAFTGWTRDGVLRHPSFKGLREDKPAEDVVVERPIAAAQDAVAGVRITHPERVLYPEAGVTKLELARWYEAAAERMLPYVSRRALAVVRCPEGRTGACFYQKHASSAFPPDVRLIELVERDGPAQCLYVEDERGLVGLAQAGVLEIHPWGSRIDDVERPDTLIFDFDPAPRTPWKAMLAAAREARDRLKTLKLEAFIKTTGGKGLHVVVPIEPANDWPEAKAFCKAFAELMAADSPDLYTTKLAKAARRGRIFIDYLRNERGATAVAPYSTRARRGAPVSTPLAWDELTPALKSDHFDVRSALRRLRDRDPWRGYANARRALPRVDRP